ncbi:uncharacterized protein LOC114741411 [Neltuma alba]|uniref:uncharacterized protein LOC114741411 n=1 Tax=Neltuma alba TaxID=207710 RepID=UPI0010A5A02B|nr:uncharacterized protein LOC114741411 [Prosopis alba]
MTRSLWLNRNEGVFNGRAIGSDKLIAQVQANARWSNPSLYTSEHGVRNSKVWHPPFLGCIKVNVDGACIKDGSSSACGGIAQNHEGEVLNSFMCNVGHGSSLHAEVWAVLWGLKRAWDSQWKRVVIVTDCMDIVELLSLGWNDDHPEGELLSEIQRWLGQEWEASIEWGRREENCAADLLAKRALSISQGIVTFSYIPDFLSDVVKADASIIVH